jgi:hypothetical protein
MIAIIEQANLASSCLCIYGCTINIGDILIVCEHRIEGTELCVQVELGIANPLCALHAVDGSATKPAGHEPIATEDWQGISLQIELYRGWSG